jgi:hypothetical protein
MALQPLMTGSQALVMDFKPEKLENEPSESQKDSQ